VIVNAWLVKTLTPSIRAIAAGSWPISRMFSGQLSHPSALGV
jgi:hypothetical protein